MQAEPRRGHEVDAGAADTGDVDPATRLAQTEFTEALAVDLGLGDEDAAVEQFALSAQPLLLLEGRLLADEGADGGGVVLGGDDQDAVVFVEDGLAGDDFGAAVATVTDAGEDKVVMRHEGRELADGAAEEGGVLDHEQQLVRLAVVAVVLGFEVGRLLVVIDAEEEAQADDGEDDADHAQGVGYGVTEGDGGGGLAVDIVVGLLRSAQPGGVGDGARENADHRLHRDTRYIMYGERKGDAQKDDGGGE